MKFEAHNISTKNIFVKICAPISVYISSQLIFVVDVVNLTLIKIQALVWEIFQFLQPCIIQRLKYQVCAS